jgi:two-component system, LytTR family, response regulator
MSRAMERIRTIIADDEPLARDRLRAMLRSEPAVDLVTECSSGPETIAALREHRPDAAFLDLQMPGCDGFAVLAELSEEERPATVLVTAHEHYAVDAFKVGVVDYLLKPFDRERLHAALQRVEEHLSARRTGPLEARLEKLLAGSAVPARRPERIVVKQKGRVVFVEPKDIQYVEAADNYVILHLISGGRLMLRESLGAMEERLGSEKFARANRSTLVQLNQVRELRSNTFGDYAVILRNGSRLPLSRNLRDSFEQAAGIA